MRHALLILLVLAGVIAGLASLGTAASAADETIAWETDLATATAKAKEEGRPLMVVFR